MSGLAGGFNVYRNSRKTGYSDRNTSVMKNDPDDMAHRLVISASFEHLHPGESIAVNGVCLTLLPMDFAFRI